MRGSVPDSAIDQLPYYSEEERYKNDKMIEEILDESYARAKRLIKNNKKSLLRLADVGARKRFKKLGGGGARNDFGRGREARAAGRGNEGLLQRDDDPAKRRRRHGQGDL